MARCSPRLAGTAAYSRAQNFTTHRAALGAPLAASPAHAYQHTATLLFDGKVLVAGGYNGGHLDSAELYDPASQTWIATSSLTSARARHTATLLSNGQVLAAGGLDGLSSAELYDPASGSMDGNRQSRDRPLRGGGDLAVERQGVGRWRDRGAVLISKPGTLRRRPRFSQSGAT